MTEKTHEQVFAERGARIVKLIRQHKALTQQLAGNVREWAAQSPTGRPVELSRSLQGALNELETAACWAEALLHGAKRHRSRVYGGSTDQGRTRIIVRASSKRDALAAFEAAGHPVTETEWRNAFAETANDLECDTAAETGAVYVHVAPAPRQPDEGYRLARPRTCAECGEWWPCSDSKRTDLRPTLRAAHRAAKSCRVDGITTDRGLMNTPCKVIRLTTYKPVDEVRAIAGSLIPIRAPHYTVGGLALADELCRAIGGVLYLDRLAQFRREHIEWLARAIADRQGLPLAIVLDCSNPFLPEGPEPSADAASVYGERTEEFAQKLEGAVPR